MAKSISLKSSQSLASIEASSNAPLFNEETIRPEALAFLKSSRSLDKMVKSYVRHPLHLKAGHHQSTPHLPRERSVSPNTTTINDPSQVASRPYIGQDLHGSSMSMTLASEVSNSRSRPGSPEHQPNEGLPYFSKRNMSLNGSPRQTLSRNRPRSRTADTRENLLPIWNEVTSHTNFPPSPTQTNIKGTLVPVNYVKESMVEVIRKHDTQRRQRIKELLGGDKKSQGASKGSTQGLDVSNRQTVTENGHIIAIKGEMAFEDSLSTGGSSTPLNLGNIDNSFFNDSIRESFNFPEGTDLLSFTNSEHFDKSTALNSRKMPSQKDLAMESLLSNTQRSKISSIIRIEDDYSAKWLRMKEKRDQRYEREIRRQARQEIMHTFKRVVLNTERNELQRAMSVIKDEQLHGDLEAREEIHQRRHHQKAALKNRIAGEKQRKYEQANQIKEAVHVTLQMANAIKEHELSLKRAQRAEMLFKMDDSTSSVVEVPHEMHERVRSATSLKAFEAAKHEIREYQESTMSSRIAKVAKSRGEAIEKVNSFGSKLSFNDIDSSHVFSDSISLQSGSLFDCNDGGSLGMQSLIQDSVSFQLPKIMQATAAPPPRSGASLMSRATGSVLSRSTSRSPQSRRTYFRVSDSPEYKRRAHKEHEERKLKELEDEKYRKHKEEGEKFDQRIASYEMRGPPTPPRFHPEWPKKFHKYSFAVDARKAKKIEERRIRKEREKEMNYSNDESV